MQDEDDNKLFDKHYEEKIPDFKSNVNIAVIGTVSSGKSSLINAILERDRENAVAEVGATSGVTTDVKSYKLDDHVLIIDAPGLDDIKQQNSDEAVKLLQHIDIGILVVTGSADAAQKRHFDALKEKADHVFVVLNKSDAWEHLNESALQSVLDQWLIELGASKIYPTVTKGYDKEARKDIPLDLRGVDALKDDIFKFLKKNKKDILLAKNMGDKKKYASGIIAAALAAVAFEAFVPGSAALITATQVVAITSLHYIYTGELLSKQSALTLLPRFAGQSLGGTIFLWAKSILPPTGVVDIAAAGIAVSITFAMLASVNYLLSNNLDILTKGTELMDKFNQYKDIDISGIMKALKDNQSIKDVISKMIS